MMPTRSRPHLLRRQMIVGVVLAVTILAAWFAAHVYGVFFYRWTPVGIVGAPLMVAFICWLDVGLFIVAHDCMHGSLAPFRPNINLWLGRICLGVYAGFSYDALIRKHFDHHRFSGTAQDPDFNNEDPEHFWRWFSAFFRRYFGWRSFCIIGLIALTYQFVLGANTLNLLTFWAAPALLSSVQLFYFGTYLPHRHEDERFGDRHNSRSSDFPWLISLLTCFHFGYHHEHHTAPHVPWWDLPRVKSGTSARA